MSLSTKLQNWMKLWTVKDWMQALYSWLLLGFQGLSQAATSGHESTEEYIYGRAKKLWSINGVAIVMQNFIAMIWPVTSVTPQRVIILDQEV